MIHHLSVNGRERTVSIAPDTRLIDVLRDQLGLTGTKQGCRAGECGACTVHVGGRPALACITLAARVQGPVTTIEGLDDALMPLRRAFAEHGGFQCGFCTPGQLMQAAALLAHAPPDLLRDETWLRAQMNGNICRCTGYGGIIRALMAPDVQALARGPAGAPARPGAPEGRDG